jgi:PIN domain nuclease of toxin-antitoxin system
VKLLLDTHFLLWVGLDVPRLAEFEWLDRYRPWAVSPVSLLEVKFLAEAGRVEVRHPEFAEAVARDPRFVVDEPSLGALIERAVPMDWTRDPFDRLLTAHSVVRSVPFCTLDRTIRKNHSLLVTELPRLAATPEPEP